MDGIVFFGGVGFCLVIDHFDCKVIGIDGIVIVRFKELMEL